MNIKYLEKDIMVNFFTEVEKNLSDKDITLTFKTSDEGDVNIKHNIYAANAVEKVVNNLKNLNIEFLGVKKDSSLEENELIFTINENTKDILRKTGPKTVASAVNIALAEVGNKKKKNVEEKQSEVEEKIITQQKVVIDNNAPFKRYGK